MSLEVHGLTKKFAGLTAVDSLSFTAEKGKVTALIGPNGAGKTTMLSMASGLLVPTSGSISFDGTPLTGLPGHKIARRGIARTYQNLQMFEEMSVLEVVMTGAHGLGRSGSIAAMLRLPSVRREEAAFEEAARSALDRVNVPVELFGREAVSLPYGLQRRVEIARALVAEPRLLLLDEPAAGLNPTETEELARLISGLRSSGLTVLLVEHDMEMVMRLSDSVVVMNFGKLIATGTPAQVQANAQVIEAYLGVEEADA
ncbi:Lipopolysaccharide export system ATP-binding protein LptB [Xylophilus ampelinus]|nr:ABC transporter ATP-binding protein [Variovorax sp.]VTY30425.1 Lipopolysaccharide export system ATP-binding protein LptB [Xylophilus ampelinus]|tara:strand:+ start:1253 stop:2023 length:771 start_codon:yes stop_codon:yes gene_type:complete